MGLLGDLIAVDVVIHQQQGQAQGETRDLHRRWSNRTVRSSVNSGVFF